MKYTISYLFALCLALVMTLGGCKSDPAPNTSLPTAEPLIKKQIPVPAFMADSAYAHIAAQVGMGPRTPNSDGHGQVRAYIERHLTRYGADVIVQDFPAKFFDGNRATGYNIIGSFNPDATRRIFLCAHYDTRPFADSDLADPARLKEPILGADDGASGVGVMLEIARLFGGNDPEMANFGVDLVFFDLEDYGMIDGETMDDAYTWALGSQFWSRQPHRASYSPRFGILLDMVGADGAVFGKEGYSKQYAGDVQTRVWNLARAMNRGDRFVEANTGGTTDDHFFINTIAGWPTIDIIYKPIGGKPPFGKHWHTHDDDLDIISKETLADVGQVVTAVVYREAGNMF